MAEHGGLAQVDRERCRGLGGDERALRHQHDGRAEAHDAADGAGGQADTQDEQQLHDGRGYARRRASGSRLR
ncbi:MAG: hypothetical protein ACREIB_07800, partial [Pseudomonadota bacterium]